MTISGVCSLLVFLMPRPRPCHQRRQHHHRSEAGVGGVRSEDAAHLLPTTQKNSENPIPSPNHIRWCVGSKSQLNPMVNSRTTNPITTANVWWEVSPANQWLVSARYRGDPSEVIDRMASNACRPEYTRERWRNAPPGPQCRPKSEPTASVNVRTVMARPRHHTEHRIQQGRTGGASLTARFRWEASRRIRRATRSPGPTPSKCREPGG